MSQVSHPALPELAGWRPARRDQYDHYYLYVRILFRDRTRP
ncbi:hypothetical protein [Arthrobacter sp. B3I4]|nr:hypothetical protein [Arthrobacter sp. B3I4]MDQ0756996.1 hypothetical protein [Arthrobacter sp. B3I4]